MENDEICRGLQNLLLTDAEGEFTTKLLSLVDTSEVERILPAVLRICEKKNLSLPLIRKLVRDEVDQTLSEGTLFRRNSVATKACTAYGKVFGSEYLRETLRRSLMTVCENNPSQLEVDPSKANLSSTDQLIYAQAALRAAADRVFDSILDGKMKCPHNLRELCRIQREETEKKFPESQLTVVGGYLFLRFFVPAITAPDGFGVLKENLNPASRRALVLVAKLIQNLANGVEFGAKEPYLSPLNGFIVDRKLHMLQYLDDISKPMVNGRNKRGNEHISETVEERETRLLEEAKKTNSDLQTLLNCFVRIQSKLVSEVSNVDDPIAKLCRLLESYTPPLSALLKSEGADVSIDKIASMAKKALKTCNHGEWQFADSVGNVRMFFAEIDSDVIDVKGEVFIRRNATDVLDSLWNIGRRKKWDPLFNTDVKVIEEFNPYMRILQVVTVPRAADGYPMPPREFFVAEQLHLKMVGEVATGDGTLVMFGDIPAKYIPTPEYATQNLIKGVLAPSGFIVTPRSDGQASSVEYVLRLSLEGGLDRAEMWGSVLDMVMALGKLEELVQEEEVLADKFHQSLQPPPPQSLRTETSIKFDMFQALDWEEDGLFSLSDCERKRSLFASSDNGELAYKGSIRTKSNVVAVVSHAWLTDPQATPDFDAKSFSVISCVHKYSPSERIVDIEMIVDEPFVSNRMFRVFRSFRKTANGGAEIVSHSINWGVNQIVLGLKPDVVFSNEFVDIIQVEPIHEDKYRCRVSRSIFGLGGGQLPVVIWNRILKNILEHSMHFLEHALHHDHD